ncbi:MAG: ankyrin repeat domain-containing protein, partial [Lentisphaeria bacterium]|nr:ankyrin repeat domain-containing protein [Lentisphaeria bacterium]
LPKDVKEIVARNDFAGARDYLRKMTEIRVYSAELEACLKDIETELLKLGLDELDVKTMTKQVRESLLNEFFADDSVTPNILHAGDEFSPDTTTINNLFGTFKERLSTFGCSQEQCDSVIATLSEKAMPLLDGKKIPVQDTELPVPLALGTSELKNRFDKLINDLAHDLIVVPEIQFHITTMTDTTNEKVAKNEYKDAHIFLKKYPVTGFKEIDDRIEETRTRLDTLLVTPAELQYHIQAINASIKGYCEKQAFAEARMALKEYPLTGIEKTDVVLEATKQKLLDDIIRPHEIVFRKAELTKAAMEALANNDYLGARLTIGNYTLTDDAVVAQEITSLKQELLDKKVTPAELKYSTGMLTTKVNELLAQNLFDDAREYIMTFTYLSEPEINKVIDDTKQSLVNDVINPAHVLFCIDAMQKTVREILPTGDFDKARMYVEDYPLVGIAAVNEGIKIGKENTILNVINPAHIAVRVKELRTNVYAALDAKNLDGARKAIKDFGVCGIKEVDAVVFAVKCGLLNVRVNVETFKAIKADYTKQMADALAAKDFAKAKKIIEDIQRIPAYSEIIDQNLDAAMDAAMEVGAGSASAQEVINETKEYLYSLIAYRRGNYEGEDIDVNREKKANWTIIKEYLQIVQNKLIDDDMDVEDAKALVDYVLKGFMESKRVQDKQGVEQDCLTTAELNDEIERLRISLRGDFTAALAAQAEADKAAAGAAARKIAEQVANEALASIDLEGSIFALQAEVTKSSDKVLTQILAEGVRVLRLMSLDRKSVTPSNATSLLAAAAYAGYDEVMNLAVTSGANINGYSVKDPLKRSPLLMSIEGGMKGHPMAVLTKANLNCLDTKGRGTVYYAVKYNNPKFLADLLRQKAASQLADEKGITPLMLAAANGNANMVTALIPFSNINEKDKEGNTAFLWAAKSASLKAVKALASAKADVKIVNAAGVGAVEFAAFNEGSIDLLGYLMNELELRPAENQIIAMIKDGNIGAMNRMAKFAKASFANEAFLLEAINGNNAAMVKLLVAQGCDLHTENVGKALKALKERIKALDVDTKTEIDVAAMTAKFREILEENGITELNCNEAQKLLCEKLMGIDVSEILKKQGIIDLNSQEAQQQVCAKAIELSEKRKAEERQQFAELVEFLGQQGIDVDLI